MNLLEYFQPQIREYPPRELPGGPVVRLHALTAEGPGSIAGQGIKIPQVVRCSQKKKKKKKENIHLKVAVTIFISSHDNI